MNPNVNYGFGVLTMYQCGFNDNSKYTTVVLDVGSRGGCLCVFGVQGTGNGWEFSIFSAQFYCEPKTVLKIVY